MELLRALHPEDSRGSQERIKSQQEEREDDITETVVALLNLAVIVRYISSGDGSEKQGHCQMCNLWDDNHTNKCPVPALEEWLAAR